MTVIIFSSYGICSSTPSIKLNRRSMPEHSFVTRPAIAFSPGSVMTLRISTFNSMRYPITSPLKRITVPTPAFVVHIAHAFRY